MAFARFNLGVALVRAGRLPEADADPHARSVRCRPTARSCCRCATGPIWRSASPICRPISPQQARAALAARTPGRAVFEPRAAGRRLGAGGARPVPRARWCRGWSCTRRSLLDAAVQESYLAVPYALRQARSAGAQAAQYYETALKSFAAESEQPQTARSRTCRRGACSATCSAAIRMPSHGWFWQLKALPDAPQSRYLYELLADNDFQEGLKNYRDLVFLQQSLSHWDGSMEAFARNDRYARARLRRARAAHRCAAGDRCAHPAARAARRRSSRGCRRSRPATMWWRSATPKEREQWARIARMQARIDDAAAEPGARQRGRQGAPDQGRAVLAAGRGLQGAQLPAAARAARARSRARGAAEPLGAGAARARQRADQQRRIRGARGGAGRSHRDALHAASGRRPARAGPVPGRPGEAGARRAAGAARAPTRSRRALRWRTSTIAPPAPAETARRPRGARRRCGHHGGADADTRRCLRSAPQRVVRHELRAACAAACGSRCPGARGGGGERAGCLRGAPCGAAGHDRRSVRQAGCRCRPARCRRPMPSAAMENYRQFLQLQNSDPKLRAEALRRLGDLNLESGELERMSDEVTKIDTQGAEAIRLYGTLLKAYPNYPRNDQVLYQLARAYDTTGQSDAGARDARSDRRRAIRRSRDIGEVQFRRGELLFSSAALRRGAAGLRGGAARWAAAVRASTPRACTSMPGRSSSRA